jgi:hypothetical protein
VLSQNEFKELGGRTEFQGIKLIFKKFLVTKVSNVARFILNKIKKKDYLYLIQFVIITKDNEYIFHYGMNIEKDMDKGKNMNEREGENYARNYN